MAQFRLSAVDHVQLAMPPGGEDEAERFYRDLLGLARQEKPPALAARGGCWFSNGSVSLHLGVETNFVAARKAHPAMMVDGFDELVDRLTTAGHAVRFDDEIPGVRRCYVDDPFGNRIELIDSGSR
ncbi:MAG TPA: VOC family protein [Acidimicrobiales bacterium]|nr:VOC family protein [Acidimicrobiales bacterium]